MHEPAEVVVAVVVVDETVVVLDERVVVVLLLDDVGGDVIVDVEAVVVEVAVEVVTGPPGPVYGGALVGSDGLGAHLRRVADEVVKATVGARGTNVETCNPCVRLANPSGPIGSTKLSGTLPLCMRVSECSPSTEDVRVAVEVIEPADACGGDILQAVCGKDVDAVASQREALPSNTHRERERGSTGGGLDRRSLPARADGEVAGALEQCDNVNVVQHGLPTIRAAHEVIARAVVRGDQRRVGRVAAAM